LNIVKTFSVKNIFFIITSIGCITAEAQITDLARFKYTFIPQEKLDKSINRFRGFVNFPFKLGREGSYIIPSVEYRNFDIDLEDSLTFNVTNLEQFQMFRIEDGHFSGSCGGMNAILRNIYCSISVEDIQF